MKKLNILMISHLYPGLFDANPYKGVFIKNQLHYLKKIANIKLIVPVDITPDISLTTSQKGFFSRLRELKIQLNRKLKVKLLAFESPVKGRYIRYISLPFKSFFSFSPGISQFLRIAKIINPNDVDIIHGQTVLLDGLSAVLLGKWFGLPVLVTARGSDIHSIGKNPITLKTVKYVLKKADLISCVSQNLKDQIIRFGIKENKVITVTNGIDLKFANKAKRKDIRVQLGIRNSEPIILSVTRFVDVKDPFTLVNAFGILRKSILGHLIIIGDGILRKPLEKHIEKLGLSSSIHLMGNLPHEDLPDYFRVCCFHCLTSKREGWPNVLFEAMIFGKPVVATAVGGVTEVVPNELYGILVPPGLPKELADAMERALHKDWQNKTIKDYAKQNSWNNTAKKYGKIYKHLSEGLSRR